MSKIIFLNNPSVIYEGSFYQIGKHQVRLTFASEIPSIDALLSGFQLVNEYNGFVQTNREDYKYIYRTYEDNPLIVELCNDDVPYVLPEPIIVPDPKPYLPTYEELLNDKINELSDTCSYLITNGLDIDGLHYSYKAEDQMNLADMANIVKTTGLPLGYHADGQSCTEYTAEELLNIYTLLTMNKYSQTVYFNQSRAYLNSLEHTKENEKIISSYEYGTPLTGIYLTTYNNMIQLYHTQLQAMLANTK